VRLSLAATVTLTDWSERTIWRRIANCSLPHKKIQGRVTLPFAAIQPYLCIALAPEEHALLARADACGGEGDAAAQNELALVFLSQGKVKSALYWLQRAAAQGHADAMSLLGGCHLRGEGVPRDEAQGLMWLAKAAAAGHMIAQRQLARP